MSYRDQVRKLLLDNPYHGDHTTLIGVVATELFNAHKTGTEEGWDKGWDSGYDGGYQTATNNLAAAGHLDRIAAFDAGVAFAEGTDKTNVFGLNGQFLRYTDPRGLTFYAGGLVFLEGLMATAMVERIFEGKLLLSNEDGALKEFSIDACRPIGGYTTPDNFLPLGAVVVRHSDGQLGLVGQTHDGGRFIGYGGTDTHIETSLEGWHETIIRPGTWVRAQTGAWYRVEAVDTNTHRLTLDDGGLRYSGQRIPGDDTVPISTCHVNVCTQHYIGERVVNIATGREGYITDNLAGDHSYGYWYVSFADYQQGPLSSHEIATVPYYYGQKVVYMGRVYTVQAVAGKVIDGRWTPTNLRIASDSQLAHRNVHVDNVSPIIEIDSIFGVSVLLKFGDVTTVHEAMSDRTIAQLITANGQRQLLSIARAFLVPAVPKEGETDGRS